MKLWTTVCARRWLGVRKGGIATGTRLYVHGNDRFLALPGAYTVFTVP